MLKRKLLLSLSLISISGCIALNPGTVEAIKITSEVKTVGDGISTASTGKTLTDHAISKAIDKDCNIFHMFNGKKFCRVRKVYEVQYMPKTNGSKLSMETIQIINSLKEKEKLNVTKLGKRHERHARKVWCARSRVKNGCK